ncbi:MAG: hypothetical protein ACLQUZ_17300 [Rhizomicrobium sp.]
MAKRKSGFGTVAKDTGFSCDLIGSLKEALACKRGEIALPTRVIERDPEAVERALAKSSRANFWTGSASARTGSPMPSACRRTASMPSSTARAA